jgi:hypothetical protein
MILSLLAVLTFQLEPRFTMTVEPDDMVRAELFEINGGLTDQVRQQLLGDAVFVAEASETFPGWGSLRVVSARRPDGTLIALADAPGHDRLGDKICMAASDPRRTIDNRARAASWCRSFFDPDGMQPIVIVPPPPPAPGT